MSHVTPEELELRQNEKVAAEERKRYLRGLMEKALPVMSGAVLRARNLVFHYDHQKIKDLAEMAVEILPDEVDQLPLTREERTTYYAFIDTVGRALLGNNEEENTRQGLMGMVMLFDLLDAFSRYLNLRITDDGEDVTDEVLGRFE